MSVRPHPQNQLQAELPFCAFNGGNDVFVDVGNKSLGLEALMNHLGFTPPEVGRGAAAGVAQPADISIACKSMWRGW